jgi:bifunctional NMN adenylyltransferase/nudix hydrolase
MTALKQIFKPSYGVCVGRFQVPDLHDGHMELFRQVRARHSGVLIFCGVAPARMTRDNPLDFRVRQKMIQAKFPEFTVLPLEDRQYDAEWSADLDAQIASVIDFGSVTLYGGRDSFVPHYHGKYTPVELTLPIEIQKITSTSIRNEVSNEVLESPEFRRGMIYAMHQVWPVMLQMVDVAPLSDDMSEVCLGRREKEKKFRFLGGHVETAKHNFEGNARAETMEEAGLELLEAIYVNSCPIDDWRYRCSDRSVMTALLVGRVASMGARAGDDIAEVRWFRLDKLTAGDLVETHHPLLQMLKEYLAKEPSDFSIPVGNSKVAIVSSKTKQIVYEQG